MRLLRRAVTWLLDRLFGEFDTTPGPRYSLDFGPPPAWGA